MKIVVTGGSGFVGSHMLECLRVKFPDSELINIDLREPKEKFHDEFLNLNLMTEDSVNSIYNLRPEMIFHLAAQSRVNPAEKDPDFTLKNNIIGTLNCLRAAHKIKKDFEKMYFMHMSSEQVYGDLDPKDLPVKENYSLQPYNTYGVSKKIAEQIAQGFAFFFPTLIIRPAMGFGPRSPPSQIVTKFFLRAMKGEPLLYSNEIKDDPSLSPTRDMSYITNTVNGVLLAAENRASGIYNITSGKDISILEIGKMIAKITGAEIQFSDDYKEREGELGKRFIIDPSKAKTEFNFIPDQISKEEGLTKTYDWLRNNVNYFNGSD